MTIRAQREPTVHDGYAIASLILSLLWVFGIGSLLAVIFGYMSDAEAKRLERRLSGFAAAGQVLGILGVLGAVGIFCLLFIRLCPSVAPSSSGSLPASDFRVYTAFGDDWFRYLMRRLAESRSA